ncbi:MAG: transporter [Deltaproteobacteria bacterium]|nr:transporter [Deltaproteobacteria bacterium]
MKKAGWLAVAFALVLAFSAVASADILDPFDNIASPPGTFALGTYFSYQDWPDYDTNGETTTLDADVLAVLLRPIWFGPKIAGKVSWGLNAVIPVARIEAAGEETQAGLGDMVISPFIFLYENEKSALYVSFWEFIYTPTGYYNENSPNTSPSLDAWQFQHQLALGWYPAPFGVDWTFNYWMREESNELNIDYQDALETDLILHWTFDFGLTAGVMGSFWWDLDELKVDGTEVDDTKGHRYAAGLNVMYPLTDYLILSARWLNDFDVENHTKGNWVYMRAVFVF